MHIKSLDCTCWSCYWILFYLPNQMLVDFGKYNGHFKGKVGSPGLVSESSRAQALFWSEPTRAWARLLQTLVVIQMSPLTVTPLTVKPHL